MNWKLSIPLLRTVLAVLLFQFFAPAFLTSPVHAEHHFNHAAVHRSHETISFPVFLKEKDEHESREDRHQDFDVPVLIDLSQLCSALTQTHEVKFDPAIHDNRFNDHPPFHKLHCTYLI